jgi:CheY-like chemotaxis protein
MDVTRFISELRSERDRIERTILSFEQFDRLSIEAAEVAAQSVIPHQLSFPRCNEASSKGRAAVKTILVLEDNASVMTVLRLMLEPYNLIEASNAEQALRLFTDHGRKIDLLVADVTLPTSSGIQVALLLRSRIPTLPVLLTSGYPVGAWSDRDTADLERLDSSSAPIIQKPFQGKTLSDAVRELIGTTPSETAGTA